MCGIAGQLNLAVERPVEPDRVEAMLDTLRHRGPDDSGLLCERNVGFGMRRLSIIDLASGHQPLANEDESLWVVYNGEIYNYLELRAELAAVGHVFRTQSDTEVLVHGYEQWGHGLFERLNGMFAFALWDRPAQRLILARDRFGIKPLFYCRTADRFVFGSEIKALLAAGVETDVDPWAINQFLAHWYVPTPCSIYRQIAKLEPGCWLEVDADGVQSGRYWNLTFAPDISPQPAQIYDEQLQSALAAAVARQMRSDVEVGAFLSGGLDSSLVTSFMAPLTPHRLKTYTIGFHEGTYGEQAEAEAIAAAIGTDHRTAFLDLDALDDFARLSGHFDEPFGDYSLLPTYAVSKLASSGAKVALTGDGGDEAFAGYPTHHVWKAAQRYRQLPGAARRLLAAAVARLPVNLDRISFDYVLRRFVRGAELDYRRGHYAWKEILSAPERAALLHPDLQAQVAADDPFECFERYFAEVADQPILNQLLYVDLRTFLLDDCLVKVDRMSMAASLEVRVPLLDNEVFDFAARLPLGYKLPGRRTKNALRRLARRQLPPQIAGLKKRGFTPPLPIWLQGPGRVWLNEILSPSHLQRAGVFQVPVVQRMIDEHLARRHDWNRPLMAVVAYVCWDLARRG